MVNGIKKTMENNLKGAMAEQLTKELFFAAGYEVHYYGVEHLVPGFLSRTEYKKRDREHSTNNVIRSLPDFLVLKDGKSYYIESKFRMDGGLVIDKDYPFPDAYIIQFTKDDILLGVASKLISGESFFEPIDVYNPLNFSDKAIFNCKELLIKYFSDTENWKKQQEQKGLNELLDKKKLND